MPNFGLEKRGVAARPVENMVDDEQPKIGTQRMQCDPCIANSLGRDRSAFSYRHERYASLLQIVSHKERDGSSFKNHVAAADVYWTAEPIGHRRSHRHFQQIV